MFFTNRKTVFIASIVFISACFFSCEKEADPVVISTFEPTSGDYETEVTITGSNFSADIEKNTVLFDGVEAEVLSASSKELVVAVPVGATTGKITIKAGGERSTTDEDFTVTAGSWSTKTSFNKAVSGTFDLTFSIGSNGYIHIVEHTVNGSKVPASLWMYSSIDNTWVQKKELSLEQTSFKAFAWGTADKGYILQYNELWEYSPANNSWIKKNALLPALNTDKVVGVFYISSVNKACAVTTDGHWFIYNPVDDSWIQYIGAPFTGTMTGSIRVQGATDRGFLMLGTAVWKYNPNGNQWTQLLSYPWDGVDFTFGINNQLYAGYTGDDYDNNTFWVLNETENKWIKKKKMGGAFRHVPVHFTLNDKGYMGLGVRELDDIFIYDFNQYSPQ